MIVPSLLAMIHTGNGASVIRCECRTFPTTTNLSLIIFALNACYKARNHLVVSLQTLVGFELFQRVIAGFQH